MLAWSGYAVISKPLAEKYGAVFTTGWALVLGTVIYLPLGLGLGDLPRLATLSRGGWGAVLYLVVLTNAVSWHIYAWALSRTEASRVAVWFNLQPVLTALLAWSLYGEQLNPAAGGGWRAGAGRRLPGRAERERDAGVPSPLVARVERPE